MPRQALSCEYMRNSSTGESFCGVGSQAVKFKISADEFANDTSTFHPKRRQSQMKLCGTMTSHVAMAHRTVSSAESFEHTFVFDIDSALND